MSDVVGHKQSQPFCFCLVIIKNFSANIEISAKHWFHLKTLPCRPVFAKSFSQSIIASHSINGTLMHWIQIEFLKRTWMKMIICPILSSSLWLLCSEQPWIISFLLSLLISRLNIIYHFKVLDCRFLAIYCIIDATGNLVGLSDKTLIIFHPSIELDDWNNILICRLKATKLQKMNFMKYENLYWNQLYSITVLVGLCNRIQDMHFRCALQVHNLAKSVNLFTLDGTACLAAINTESM